MEIVAILNALWRRRIWVLAAAVVALGVGIKTAYHVTLSPPSLKTKSFQVGSASTQLLLDSPQSSLVAINEDLSRLATRASIFATFMRGGTLTAGIAQRVGIPVDRVTSSGPYTGPGDANGEVIEEKRANQLISEHKIYRFRFDSGSSDKPLPLLTVYAQAPTAGEAIKLADAAAAELKDYVAREAAKSGAPPNERLVVHQIKPAEGGVIAENVAGRAVALTGMMAFVGLLVVIVILSGLLDNWKLERQMRRFLAPADAPTGSHDEADLVTANGHGNGSANGNGNGTGPGQAVGHPVERPGERSVH